jgi:hypothetical protein
MQAVNHSATRYRAGCRIGRIVRVVVEIVCISGPVPGVVTATVSHLGAIRTVKMEVAAHPSGGWHARLLAGSSWGLRCHSVPTAIMLEAAEVFVDEPMLLAAD